MPGHLEHVCGAAHQTRGTSRSSSLCKQRAPKFTLIANIPYSHSSLSYFKIISHLNLHALETTHGMQISINFYYLCQYFLLITIYLILSCLRFLNCTHKIQYFFACKTTSWKESKIFFNVTHANSKTISTQIYFKDIKIYLNIACWFLKFFCLVTYSFKSE